MKPLRRLVDSPPFSGAVVAVILANALILGLQTYAGPVSSGAAVATAERTVDERALGVGLAGG